MFRFFTPGINLMNRLRYRQKFTLVAFVLVLPLLLSMVLVLIRSSGDLTQANQERDGMNLVMPLIRFMWHVQDHRVYAMLAANGHTPAQEQVTRSEKAIAENIEAIDSAVSLARANPSQVKTWQALKADWQNLRDTKMQTSSTSDVYSVHTNIVQEVLTLIKDVGNGSNIVLDTTTGAHYLGDLLIIRMPTATEYMGQLHAYGSVATVRKTLSVLDRSGLPILAGLARSEINESLRDIDYVFSSTQGVAANLQGRLDAYLNTTKYFLDRANGRVLASLQAENQKTMPDVEEYAEATAAVSRDATALYEGIADSFDRLLRERAEALNGEYLGLTFAVLAALAVSIYLFNAFYLSVRRTIETLDEASNQLVEGNLNETLALEGRDELTQVAGSFNNIARALIRTNRDLAQQKHDLEVANAMAKEASRLKSEFLSTMSHELRTPLNAIIGFTGILLAGMDGEIDQAATYMIERVDSNSKRLLNLINDVLDISRIEAGRMEVMESQVQLRQLVEQWQQQVGILAERKGLTFEYDVAPDLPEGIYLDRERVTRITLNLLSNAVKFTEQGRIHLSLKKVDDSLVIQVSDTGIGIPPHALNYIFEEFRQVDGTSRRAYGGTGLGLAIARNLCRLMNGKIAVQSTLGQGSDFTVTLPLRPVHSESTPVEPIVAGSAA